MWLKQRKNANPQSACQKKAPVFSTLSLPLSFQHPFIFHSAETKDSIPAGPQRQLHSHQIPNLPHQYI